MVSATTARDVRRRAITSGLLLFLLLADAVSGGPDKAGIDMLSVRESLVPLFAIHDLPRKAGHPYSVLTFPYDRINPKVQRYVIAHLEEKLATAPSYHASGDMHLLGRVATQADVRWMDGYMESLIRKLGDRDGNRRVGGDFATQAGIFAGMALVRRPDSGGELVAKYSSVSAWAPLGIAKLPHMNLTPAQIACGEFVSCAFIYSKSPHLLALLRNQLTDPDRSLGVKVGTVEYATGLEKSGYASYADPRQVSRAEQDRAVAGCVERYGKQIDALMQRVDNPSAVQAAPPAPVVPTERVVARPQAAPVPISGPAADYAAALIQEGVASYTIIARAWREGDMEVLRGRLLDNAEPLGDRFERLLQTPKEVKRQKQILLGVVNMGPVVHRDFDVKLETRGSWRGRSAAAPGGSGKVLGNESVILTFTIPNSAAVLEKYPPGPIPFPKRTSTRNGDLRIYMRKIDGKWYWNPFGW